MKIANRLGIVIAVLATGALAGGGIALVTSASAAPGHPAAGTDSVVSASRHVSYAFSTLDDHADPTFNQLLGINDSGMIAGYFGSGMPGHPNQGYLLAGGAYTSENFPNSVQTQVTGLNNRGVTVGFWSDMSTATSTSGFYAANGVFHNVPAPVAGDATQLLGVNDSGVAAGFYTDAHGSNHGFEYRIGSGGFRTVTAPGHPGASLTAAAIDDRGDVAGFYNLSNGTSVGFLKSATTQFRELAYPGASATQALGVNGSGEVVGDYTDGSGKSATMHGFTWTAGGGFASVDDPHGAGATAVNGVDDHGDLVGFYTDSHGNTDGFQAVPLAPSVVRVRLASMPSASVVLSWTASGTLMTTINGYGFTPGSAHDVELASPDGSLITSFSPVIANGAGQIASALSYSTDTAQIPLGSRVLITLDHSTGAIASPAIAQTPPITSGVMSYPLRAVEISPSGTSYGTPQGWAVVAYDPSTRTITVTLTASGLTPGAHAAHIHIGSCRNQGPVQYMLMDFVANGAGQIQHQVRTVTGVTAPIPASGWYLNLHQGNSGNILSGGQPTALFRPLLCSAI